MIKSEMFYLALINGLSYMYKVKWESSMDLNEARWLILKQYVF